jgi:hypothetical protein
MADKVDSRRQWDFAERFTHGAVEELLKEAAAAKFLAVSARTMEAWRHQGKGPRFVVLSRKAVRYRPTELMAFVKIRERG